MSLIRKGCGCKTGYSSSRCKCKKRNSYCSPGCKCIGCTNLPVEAEQEDADSAVRSSEIDEQSDVELSSSDNDGSHLDVEVNQLMRDNLWRL